MARAKKLSHLEWLVKQRSRNQQTSLALHQLMKSHSAQLRKDYDIRTAAIAMVAISFSLWRAVFLADRSDSEEESFNHAMSFLETLIGDNAIGYAHDKNAREWTFSYYMNNANFRLAAISQWEEKYLPAFDSDLDLEPRAHWEYCQDSLDIAVRNFAKAMKAKA